MYKCVWNKCLGITLLNDYYVLCNVNCDGIKFKDYCGLYTPDKLRMIDESEGLNTCSISDIVREGD